MEMVVQKLPPVVGINPEKGEGKLRLDPGEGGANPVLASVPGRAHFRPSAEDVGGRQAPEEVLAHVPAAVGDGVGLDPPVLPRVPALGPHRDERLDRSVGFRRPPVDDPLSDFPRREHPVDLHGADGERPVADL
jgi:hypothetical protein